MSWKSILKRVGVAIVTVGISELVHAIAGSRAGDIVGQIAGAVAAGDTSSLPPKHAEAADKLTQAIQAASVRGRAIIPPPDHGRPR